MYFPSLSSGRRLRMPSLMQSGKTIRFPLPSGPSEMMSAICRYRYLRLVLISDNQRDLTYSSGMMMETETEEEARSRKTRSTSGERRCPHCNEDSHQRRTSRLCPKNKRNLDRAEAASMRDAKKRTKISTTFENPVYCTMW
jgi:hypothetical protein